MEPHAQGGAERRPVASRSNHATTVSQPEETATSSPPPSDKDEDSSSSPRESLPDDNNNDDDDDDDDENNVVWTFRVLFLGTLSFVFLVIANKYYLRETAESVMSMVTTMAVAYPAALVMAKRLPRRRIYLRAFDFEFGLNPGPFSMREYVLISTLGNLGAVYGGLTSYSIPHSLSF